MSQRNRIGAAGTTVLVTLGVAGLLEQLSATASCAVALAFGALLLIGAVVLRRASNEPRTSLVELRRVREHKGPHR
jgi:hypothetical protein